MAISRRSAFCIAAGAVLSTAMAAPILVPVTLPPIYEKNEADDAPVLAVAFAGDRGRIRTGLELYLNGQVSHLLITGDDASPATGVNTAEEFVRYFGLKAERSLENIYFDFRSINTSESARYAADFSARHHLKTIVAITSPDHMPRVVVLLRDAMRDATFYTYPARNREWEANPVTEALKVGATRIGIPELPHRRVGAFRFPAFR